MEGKMTINDIAKLSGVAKSTVSRYLNGGSVGEATRRKIQKVIEANHYQPNVFARLHAKESRIIGLIVPGFDSVTTPCLVEAIVAYLKDRDYTPLIMHTGNDLGEEIRCMEQLGAMNVDGMMVLAAGVSAKHKTLPEKAGIPVLFMGQRVEGAVSIINDDYHAGYVLGKYLAGQGLQRAAGLWVDDSDPAIGIERKRGVEDGLASEGAGSVDWHETTFFFQDAVQAAERLLRKKPLPDVVVCATDRIAQGVYKAACDSGLTIPGHISVTGFGDYETSQLLSPPLTTIRYDLDSWGRASAETMLQMIRKSPVNGVQINSYELIKRGSVRERKP